LITLNINGREVSVPEGTTVASAILNLDETAFRRSVTGEPRGPLCGMGICFECRVMVNGELHRRSCTLPAEDRMEVVTDE
jgi:D-hydroxyproline dehydrogenase subunit gamma